MDDGGESSPFDLLFKVLNFGGVGDIFRIGFLDEYRWRGFLLLRISRVDAFVSQGKQNLLC